MTTRKAAYNLGGSAADLHGFVLTAAGVQQSTLAYAVGTRKVTLAPTGSTTPVYVNGTRFELTSTEKAHTTAEGLHVFYFDTSGVPQVSIGFPALDWSQFSIYAMVLYSTSGAAAQGILMEERHKAPRDLSWHQAQHYSVGTILKSGIEIDPLTYTLNTDSNAAVTPGFTSGHILDEDIDSTIDARPEGTYLVFRRTATFWRWDSGSFPFPVSGGYPAWDNAGTLTALSGAGIGEWMNVWVLAIPAKAGAEQLLFIPGHAKFTSLAAAQAESVTSLSSANIPFVEFTPRYQLTYHARSSYGGTYKCRLESVQQLIGTKASVTGVTTPTANGIPFTPSDTTKWGDAPRSAVGAALDSLASGVNRRTDYTSPTASPWVMRRGDAGTGPGSATFDSGTLLLTLGAGETASHENATFTAPESYRVHTCGDRIRIEVNVAALSLEFALNSRALQLSIEGRVWDLHLRVLEGGLVITGYSGAGLGFNPISIPMVAIPVDGTGYIGIETNGHTVEWLYGTGTDIDAVTWHHLDSQLDGLGATHVHPARTVVSLTLVSDGGQTGTISARCGATRIIDLRAVV